eukprot:617414-Pelagomonas_calceolata.AAC.4
MCQVFGQGWRDGFRALMSQHKVRYGPRQQTPKSGHEDGEQMPILPRSNWKGSIGKEQYPGLCCTALSAGEEIHADRLTGKF